MADSLRDQLLKSGIVTLAARKAPPDKPAAARKPARKPQKPPKAGEIDLAKAYALRSQMQDRERQQAERAAAEQARLRRERKARIQELLAAGNVLNKAGAEHPRHFEYAGKIRRVYVDAEQLRALNRGELGIVQQGGRYLVVSGDVARQIQAIDAHHLALLVDPAEAAAGDDGVPDDLMW